MANFYDYLNEVQKHKGLGPVDLIRDWKRQEILTVKKALQRAVKKSGIINSKIPNFANISNQSKGNKAADYFISKISGLLPIPNSINPARGAGYPDQIFNNGAVGFCMEIKATSNWQSSDSNRRVLISSPKKMLSLIKDKEIDDPPTHLVCTVLYNEKDSTVTGIRLDFLEPKSEVNIRLEASTSQRLLSRGPHRNIIIR